MELLLLIAAPCLQIILSVLRVMNRIKLPLLIIPAITFILGLIFTVAATRIMMINLSAAGVHCGVPAGACIVIGGFITFTATPIISAIFFFINGKKKAEAKAPAIIPTNSLKL